jgi:2-polyprenyl-6-methoxyphenol hydroxylase-like FAD-dependent oxidoreductase
MRVVICGAGIAGLALAHRLSAHGWQVHVIERAPGPREQGYMIDFFGAGYDAAESMGILPRLKELAYPVEEAAFIDARSRRRARIDYARFAGALNGRLLDVMRPDLERALREQVANKVELRFDCGPAQIENVPDGVAITLTDGTRLHADLLVGADGIHSTVRQLVFGPETHFLRYLGFHTAAFIFDDPEMHGWLKRRFSMTDSTIRMMGFYGLRNGKVAVFAVHRSDDPALPLDRQAAIRQAYASLGWLVPRALAMCPPSPEVYYDQVAQIVMPEWSRGRVTLLGDACGAVSLLAGQGASLAVAGAYVLGELLSNAESIESALSSYQSCWWPIVTEQQRIGRRDAEWFLPSSSIALWLRRLMLGVSTLPGLDALVARALVGKSTQNLIPA